METDQHAAGHVQPRNRAEHRHPELLDWEGAANYLATSPRHIRKLWAERRLAAVRIGGLIRFRVEDLDAFVEAHRVDAIR